MKITLRRRSLIVLMGAIVFLLSAPMEALAVNPSGQDTGSNYVVTISCKIGDDTWQSPAASTVYAVIPTLPDTLTVTFKATSTCGGEYKNVYWDPDISGTIVDYVGTPDTDGSDGEVSFTGTLKQNSNGTYTMSASSPSAGDPDKQTASITLKILKLDFDIYQGQGGAVVPEASEESVGAFTVANLNDSNYNGTADKDENPVTDEKDLMRLDLNKPAPDPAAGTVRIIFTSGSGNVWTTSTKTTQVTNFEVAVTDLPKTWYIEATAPTALQGIKIQYEFKAPSRAVWMEGDKVSATAVWASCTDVVSEDLSAAQVDARLGNDWINHADDGSGAGCGPRTLINVGWLAAPHPMHHPTQGTGTSPSVDWQYSNVIVLEFTIDPSNIATVPSTYGNGVKARPLFDIGRVVYRSAFWWQAGEGDPQHPSPATVHFPPADDDVNDDSANEDETAEPTQEGHMWVIDGPGFKYPPTTDGLNIYRGNFKEFVRAGLGVEPSGANNGSRCSAKQGWYSKDTAGLVTTPETIAGGSFTFAREPLYTQVNRTSPSSSLTTTIGMRHHAVMRGLGLKTDLSAATGKLTLNVIDEDFSDDTIDIVEKTPVGIDGNTVDGDVVGYTGVGYLASRFDGEIAGEDGLSGTSTANIAHEIEVSGANPQSPSKGVTGTSFSLPSPEQIGAMEMGAITTVTVNDARAEAEDSSGGNQTVNITLIDDETSVDTLQRNSVQAPKLMKDDAAGTPDVTAIKYGLVNEFDFTGRIGSKADGEVIGPDGESGEQNAEIAYVIQDVKSPSVGATGPVYTKPAPSVSTNPIPIDGSSTVTMDSVYIEATGSSGSEDFTVRVIDADDLSDDVLDSVSASIARPASCFPGALIGPATPAVEGTLTNPSPGGEVKGPDGASGETEAEIGYEIGSSSSNSATTSVTATSP